jgi:hypothetical protein
VRQRRRELAPPRDLEATSLNDRLAVELRWDEAGDPETIVIERTSTGLAKDWTLLEVINAGTNEHVDEEGLRDGVEYSYRVKSVRGSEESDYSNVANAEIDAMVTPTLSPSTPTP